MIVGVSLSVFFFYFQIALIIFPLFYLQLTATTPPVLLILGMASEVQLKRQRENTSGDSCITCSQDVEENGVECNWCLRWEHCECAGISSNEYTVLSNSSSKIMFFCSICYTKVPFALKVKDEATNNHETLQKSLESINSNLSKLHSNVSEVAKNLGTQIDKHQKTFAEVLADHPADVPMQSAPPSLSEDSVAHITVSLATEQKEKEKRQLNIIVHNVEESSATDGVSRKKDDISRCMTLFQTHLGISATINNAFRPGKKSAKPRLLKLSLSNVQDKSSILKNKTKLRSSSNPSDVRKIFITPDFTPLEQKQNKALRQQLATMNKDKKLYIIKNGKIVQRTP